MAAAALVMELSASAVCAGRAQEFLETFAAYAIKNGFTSVASFAGTSLEDWDTETMEGYPSFSAGARALVKQLGSPQVVAPVTPVGLPFPSVPAGDGATQLAEAMAEAMAKARKPAKPVHVDVMTKLSHTSLESLGLGVYPDSRVVDDLATALRDQREQGAQQPFIFVSLSRFLPAWNLEEIGKELLLPPALWSAAYMRYALAADAVGMVRLSWQAPFA